MNEDKVLKYASKGMSDKDVLFFDQLEAMGETLKEIASKEILEMPEIPEVDLTETNTLLRQLVEKEDKPQQVRVTLKVL